MFGIMVRLDMFIVLVAQYCLSICDRALALYAILVQFCKVLVACVMQGQLVMCELNIPYNLWTLTSLECTVWRMVLSSYCEGWIGTYIRCF